MGRAERRLRGILQLARTQNPIFSVEQDQHFTSGASQKNSGS